MELKRGAGIRKGYVGVSSKNMWKSYKHGERGKWYSLAHSVPLAGERFGRFDIKKRMV